MVQLKELGLVSDGVSLCCVSFYPRVNNVLLYGLGFSSKKVSAIWWSFRFYHVAIPKS